MPLIEFKSSSFLDCTTLIFYASSLISPSILRVVLLLWEILNFTFLIQSQRLKSDYKTDADAMGKSIKKFELIS